MTLQRKRTALARRRRADEEGDDMSVATEVADDSQSDVSLPSDIDEDADADNSDLSETDSPQSIRQRKKDGKINGSPRVNRARPESGTRRAPSPTIARSDAVFTASKDTELMRSGIKAAEKASNDDVVDFETGHAPVATPGTANRSETAAERRRRDDEEHGKNKAENPTHVPTRGAFFLHDHRLASGHNGSRQFGRGGGGRGGRGGGSMAASYPLANSRTQASSEAIDAPWQHDLHETVADAAHQPQQRAQFQLQAPARSGAAMNTAPIAPAHTGYAPPPAAKQAPPRNFSTTIHTHNAQVRVYLPGMAGPIHFQNVPIKQHTRLPNHRPPLRRDKPVRISLPPSSPRYIFPTVERSFIFIPRALRPNQQGFGRGRGRGFGSFGGGFSSRRTSAYGGSAYSPSVAMSRRSSLAREMGRDGLVSPAGSVISRSGAFVDPARPVVRLPPGPRMPAAPSVVSPQMGNAPSMPLQQNYPLPQKPAFRENWQGQLTMHQPRPQKTVSVAGIESPASMTFNPPQQQEQQPFHQQVPAHMNGNAPPSEQQQPLYPHTRQLSYPSQASTGTPLSNIPERAIHAPAFQPFQQPNYPPQPYPMGPGYYYPNATQPFVPPAGMVPMYQQPSFVMPVPAPNVSAAPTPVTQSNLVAYESNGVTYYVDQTQLYSAPPMEGYPQASYAVPGMGGMMTPSPEGATYYYPQQMQPPLQPAAPVYYPPQ